MFLSLMLLHLWPIVRTLPIADLDPSTRYLLVGVAVMTILVTVFRPMMRKKDPLSNTPSRNSLAQQRNVERQMESLLVDLEKMARQMTASLETRAVKLETLIREADEKLAQLKAAGLGTASTASLIEARQMRAAGVENVSLGEGTPPSEPLTAPAAPPDDPRHREVYSLADQGRSPGEIASALGKPSGEVELILALRGNRP